MKTNVTILVQGEKENAGEFGDRITAVVAERILILSNPIQFTSDANGRQTCNIIHSVKDSNSEQKG